MYVFFLFVCLCVDCYIITAYGDNVRQFKDFLNITYLQYTNIDLNLSYLKMPTKYKTNGFPFIMRFCYCNLVTVI